MSHHWCIVKSLHKQNDQSNLVFRWERMRTFVIGDIHGQHAALVDCLKQCQFDCANDRLIALGDVCDRGPNVRGCVDKLLEIRHLVFILGNHDALALDWALDGQADKEWLNDGGAETTLAYKGIGMPKAHIRLLVEAPLYFEEDGRLFVHGGFDLDRGVKSTPEEVILWDRTLLKTAQQTNVFYPDKELGGYAEIFIGHTPTLFYQRKNAPQKFCNVWAMDTGACFHGGRLSIMDVETKQFWQSYQRR